MLKMYKVDINRRHLLCIWQGRLESFSLGKRDITKLGIKYGQWITVRIQNDRPVEFGPGLVGAVQNYSVEQACIAFWNNNFEFEGFPTEYIPWIVNQLKKNNIDIKSSDYLRDINKDSWESFVWAWTQVQLRNDIKETKDLSRRLEITGVPYPVQVDGDVISVGPDASWSLDTDHGSSDWAGEFKLKNIDGLYEQYQSLIDPAIKEYRAGMQKYYSAVEALKEGIKSRLSEGTKLPHVVAQNVFSLIY